MSLSVLSRACWLGQILSRLLLFVGLAVSAAAAPPAGTAKGFRRGVSIGHWMAQVREGETFGGPWFGAADLAWLAKQGFDHVRIPVDGRLWVLPNGALDESKIERFLAVAHAARDLQLGVLLDLHFLPGGRYDPDKQDLALFTESTVRAKAVYFWTRLTERFAAEGDYLRFELLNEPRAADHRQLSDFFRSLVASIRVYDRTRVLYVTSNRASSFATLPEVFLPADPRVGLILHYNEPLIFTHQRAPGEQLPADMPTVSFPGQVPELRRHLPADHPLVGESGRELTVAEIEADFVRVARWVAQRAPGREILLGGFGCSDLAPTESRRVYIAAVRQAAERRGWGWTVWDYKSNFGIRAADGSTTVILDGLFDAASPGR